MNSEQFDTHYFLKILDRSINYLRRINFLYNQGIPKIFLVHRYLLFLHKSFALRNIRRLLNDVPEELSNDSDFLNLVLKKLDKLPSSALTDKRLRTIIENIFMVPDIQNVFVYQSSEIPSALYRKLAILRISESITSRSSPEERFLTMKYLVENGFFTEARRLLNTGVGHLNEIIDYVFSPEAQPHYADNLVFLLNQVKIRRTLHPTTHKQKLFLDRQLLFINKQKGNIPKIVLHSFKKDVSVTPFKWNSIRHWIEKKRYMEN